MQTLGARRSRPDVGSETVFDRRALAQLGYAAHDIDRQVAARRWQRFGPGVLLHNAPPNRDEYRDLCMINCGPRAVLTSFTAAEVFGLRGFERNEVHVLAPKGTTQPRLRGLVLHRVGRWQPDTVIAGRRLHLIAPAMVLAAASFARPRPGCAILAAAVQQRLVTPDELRAALDEAPRARHRRSLLLALADIAQGAEALSEIDFVRVCRRHGLPPPSHQAVRVQPGGRRRYLDAHWDLGDGRRFAVEVDGAHHMRVGQWSADQLRQNEVVIGGTPVLRFTSVAVREDELLVIDQLRRMIAEGAQ